MIFLHLHENRKRNGLVPQHFYDIYINVSYRLAPSKSCRVKLFRDFDYSTERRANHRPRDIRDGNEIIAVVICYRNLTIYRLTSHRVKIRTSYVIVEIDQFPKYFNGSTAFHVVRKCLKSERNTCGYSENHQFREISTDVS